MAKTIYDLSQNISVASGQFTVDGSNAASVTGTTTVKAGTKTAVIEDKKGLLIAGADNEYSFTALSGGEFEFKDHQSQAEITSFDASAVSSAVKINVDASQNAKLSNKGRILEAGRHQELLDRKGSYYRLYMAQMN